MSGTREGTGEDGREVCSGCDQEIDPDCCGCGDSKQGHSAWGGHPFVPMGCHCYRDKGESDSEDDDGNE